MVSNLRIYLHPQNRQHILLFKNFRTFLGNHFPFLRSIFVLILNFVLPDQCTMCNVTAPCCQA